MSKKKLVGLLAVAAFSLNAVTVAFAQDFAWVDTEDYGRVLVIEDTRLNKFDVAAPVAIYYTYHSVVNDDATVQEVPDGIELLAIDPETNQGHLVLAADLTALQSLISGEVETVAAGGYSLHYSSGYFWVTAPPDAEGKVYSFTWANETFAAG